MKNSNLIKKYPKILKNGVCCGDGWYWVLDNLCYLLQWDTDNNHHPQLVASQVKEKYGTLRFYTYGCNERQQGMINFAERLSSIVCENCGSMNKVKQTKGWVITLCEKCMMEHQKKQKG